MRCREYIFLLTSEQLTGAALPTRLSAGYHRLICRRCKAFTANDARLDSLVREAADAATHAEADPAAPPQP